MSAETITAKAVVQKDRKLVEESIALPKLKEHQVLVQVSHAAFNPTDRLAFEVDAFGDGAVLGCDFSGTVTLLGPKVTRFKLGDKIAGLIWGGEIKGLGAYSTYTIADERIAYKVPKSTSPLEASTIPLACNTSWLALFSSDCLAIKRENPQKPSLLVWGGSSAVGIFAIQIAAANGITVTTTCSPRNFENVKKAGATHVFDYRDADVAEKIKQKVPDLTLVFDTIGNSTSSEIAGKAVGDSAGILCTVRPGKANTENVPKHVKVVDVFVFTAFLSEHTYRGKAHWPVHVENHELSAELYEKLPEYLGSGSITPLPAKLLGDISPETLIEAMDLNREGKVSNEKLCFSVQT